MSDSESIALRADPSELVALRAFVSDWAERHGVGSEATFSACLVATEAVTNAMRHGALPGDGGHPITVSCAMSGDDVVVAVTDRGRFRSRRDREGDHGGRGLFIIAELTRSFELESRAEGTRLSMRLPAFATPVAPTSGA